MGDTNADPRSERGEKESSHLRVIGYLISVALLAKNPLRNEQPIESSRLLGLRDD